MIKFRDNLLEAIGVIPFVTMIGAAIASLKSALQLEVTELTIESLLYVVPNILFNIFYALLFSITSLPFIYIGCRLLSKSKWSGKFLYASTASLFLMWLALELVFLSNSSLNAIFAIPFMAVLSALFWKSKSDA